MNPANLGDLNSLYSHEVNVRYDVLAEVDLVRFGGAGVSEGGDWACQRAAANLRVHDGGNGGEGDERYRLMNLLDRQGVGGSGIAQEIDSAHRVAAANIGLHSGGNDQVYDERSQVLAAADRERFCDGGYIRRG